MCLQRSLRAGAGPDGGTLGVRSGERRLGKGAEIIGRCVLTISGWLVPRAVIRLVRDVRHAGIAKPRPGMIAVYTGMSLSTSIFFMTGFIRTLPYELEEAARIDGASSWKVFSRIVLPLL